jgi:hypothetical protein
LVRRAHDARVNGFGSCELHSAQDEKHAAITLVETAYGAGIKGFDSFHSPID